MRAVPVIASTLRWPARIAPSEAGSTLNTAGMWPPIRSLFSAAAPL